MAVLKDLRSTIRITSCGYGIYTDPHTLNGCVVTKYTLTNGNKFKVEIIDFGATIISLKMPDKIDYVEELILGYESLEDYIKYPNLGTVLGKIKYQELCDPCLWNSSQEEPSYYHTYCFDDIKTDRFDKVVWQSQIEDECVVMSYCHEIFIITVIFSINEQNELSIVVKATTSKPIQLYLVNCCYLNLAGYWKGAKELYNHTFQINADQFTTTRSDEVDVIHNVKGTLWDFREPRLLKNIIKYVPYGGYDQNLCVNRCHQEERTFVARVVHLDTGRTLEVYSNQPCVAFHTANQLPLDPLVLINEGVVNDFEIIGRNGVHYYKHGAFCLHPQPYPTSMVKLAPGQLYHHLINYRFGIYEEVDFNPPLTPYTLSCGEFETELQYDALLPPMPESEESETDKK